MFGKEALKVRKYLLLSVHKNDIFVFPPVINLENRFLKNTNLMRILL